MPLPDYNRVIYQKNPLVEVVFEARFPRLLAIETELPVEFQKKVTQLYPLYEQRQLIQITLAANAGDGRSPTEMQGRSHVFQTLDKVWSVSLTAGSIALTTQKYVKWEDFRDRLVHVLASFLSTYQPPVFTRIGLRYQDVIDREAIGVASRSWKELLKPHVGGELGVGEFAEADVVSRQSLATIRLEHGDLLQLKHGLVQHNESKKVAYLIDSDFYNEQNQLVNTDGIRAIAERLHTNSGRLFRWCISDTLHNAMEPHTVP